MSLVRMFPHVRQTDYLQFEHLDTPIHLDHLQYHRYYICRYEMLCKSRIVQIPRGKHVRQWHEEPRHTDVDRADNLNQGFSCFEMSDLSDILHVCNRSVIAAASCHLSLCGAYR